MDTGVPPSVITSVCPRAASARVAATCAASRSRARPSSCADPGISIFVGLPKVTVMFSLAVCVGSVSLLTALASRSLGPPASWVINQVNSWAGSVIEVHRGSATRYRCARSK